MLVRTVALTKKMARTAYEQDGLQASVGSGGLETGEVASGR
ncbi:hypothetical protein [Novosphingobium sp. 9]|nr:hypothetical protein [Novosphingobium sp. 9]